VISETASHGGHAWQVTEASLRRVGSRDRYRSELSAMNDSDWPDYLRERSGLPGPRGNIELAQAVADQGDPACFDRFIATDDEYLMFCGVLGLGRLLAETGSNAIETRLRGHAVDPRWRIREAVAMALQRLGDADLARLRDLVVRWCADPHSLVLRAAVAGICEPRLLRSAGGAACALEACARATDQLTALPPERRRESAVRTLRQALGYCWSVAVAANPGAGLPRFEALAACTDPDAGWIVRENSKKARLATLI
jgi:hypothetical protein